MTIVVKKFENSRVALIERLLTDNGPMTRGEMVAHGLPKDVGSSISRLCVASPQCPQRLHIVDWVNEQPGARNYLRAVYELGPGENKPKPKADNNKKRTHKYHVKAKSTVASVFELGLFVVDRIKLTRRRRSAARRLDSLVAQTRRHDSGTPNS